MNRLMIAVSVGAMSGCAVGVDESAGETGEEEGQSVEALNGNLTTSGCTGTEVAKLQAAITHANEEMTFGGFFQCLYDSTLVWANGATPEWIDRRLRENMPTKITCVADGACTLPDGTEGLACAPIGNSTEEMKVERDYLATADTLELSGTIVHEVAHNKGWTHPGADDYAFEATVPLQVGRCIDSGTPALVDRSTLTQEVELPHVGGLGGVPFELACNRCGLARGLTVQSSSDNINRISMQCDTSSTGNVGTTNNSTTTISGQCAANEVLVGLVGASLSMVNGLIGVCADRASVAAGGSDVTQWIYLGGSFSAPDITLRQCPDGMAIKRIYGRAGARIDQMRVVCEDLTGTKQGVPYSLPIAGTANGYTRRAQCMGNGAMVGLYGRAGAEVDQLGGVCFPTEAGPSGDVVLDSVNFEALHILESQGGEGGTDFVANCPSTNGEVTHAIVGLEVRSGARLDQVRGVCADATAWSSSVQPPPAFTYTASAGYIGGNPSQRMCKRGEFVVGVQVWSAMSQNHATQTVHGLVPICRKLDYLAPGAIDLSCVGGIGVGP